MRVHPYLLLAVLDYGFQWWKQEQDMKMSDDEMRDEMKMMNGDPQMAARRRAFQAPTDVQSHPVVGTEGRRNYH